jgi:MFS family permease
MNGTNGKEPFHNAIRLFRSFRLFRYLCPDLPADRRSATGQARLPRNVIALGLVSLFNDASSEIIYPLLPLFLASTLGASMRFIGLIEGVTESASSLLKYPAGWLSDRIGKRKALVVFGYGLAAAVRPLLALTGAAWQVLGLRFIDRIGKGVRSAPRDALIADSAAVERRGLAFGFHRAMDHAGAIIGALASWWLITLFAGDYRSVFWAATAPAFVALLILIFAVREAGAGERGSGGAGEPATSSPALPLSRSPALPLSRSPSPRFSVFDNNFKRYLGVLLLFTLGNSSDAFLLLRAQQCCGDGVSVAMIPMLWAALHVSKTVSSVIGGGLSDRFGRKRLIISGWIVYAAIYFGFAVASTQPEMWSLFIVYGVYFGLTEGVEKALVADLTPADLRGTAFGLYNLVIGIGALPASLMLGALWDRFGATAALMTGAGLSLLAAVLLALAVRESNSSG